MVKLGVREIDRKKRKKIRKLLDNVNELNECIDDIINSWASDSTVVQLKKRGISKTNVPDKIKSFHVRKGRVIKRKCKQVIKRKCKRNVIKKIGLLERMLPGEGSGRMADSNAGCKCNKNPLSFTRTFGCTQDMWQGNRCKFHQLSVICGLEKEKFKLTYQGNDRPLEDFCHKVVDIISTTLKRYAPLAFLNLKEHIKDAKACQLGKKSEKVFGGLSIVNSIRLLAISTSIAATPPQVRLVY